MESKIKSLVMVKMKAYSQDLRDRVIELYKTSKYKIKAISELLGIERYTISNWIKRLKKMETMAQDNISKAGVKPSLQIRVKYNWVSNN